MKFKKSINNHRRLKFLKFYFKIFHQKIGKSLSIVVLKIFIIKRLSTRNIKPASSAKIKRIFLGFKLKIFLNWFCINKTKSSVLFSIKNFLESISSSKIICWVVFVFLMTFFLTHQQIHNQNHNKISAGKNFVK